MTGNKHIRKACEKKRQILGLPMEPGWTGGGGGEQLLPPQTLPATHLDLRAGYWDLLSKHLKLPVNCQDIILMPSTRWGRGISVPSTTDWSALNLETILGGPGRLPMEPQNESRVKKLKKESAGSPP